MSKYTRRVRGRPKVAISTRDLLIGGQRQLLADGHVSHGFLDADVVVVALRAVSV